MERRKLPESLEGLGWGDEHSWSSRPTLMKGWGRYVVARDSKRFAMLCGYIIPLGVAQETPETI